MGNAANTQKLLYCDTMPRITCSVRRIFVFEYCCVCVCSVIAMCLNRTAWDQREAHFRKNQKKTGMSGSDINVLKQGTVKDLDNG